MFYSENHENKEIFKINCFTLKAPNLAPKGGISS